MPKLSILDLTADDAAAIEGQVGKPIDEWAAVSKGKLLPLVLAKLTGRDLAEFRAMSIGELLELVGYQDTPEGNADGAS